MAKLTTIGTYNVLKKIGEGGMGTVYLGEHTLLGRRAAIKVLLPTLSVNQNIVRRFFNEARAVTQIADPGIVQVFDFGHHTDGSAFIVMELLDGEQLDKRIRRLGRFGVADCLRLIRMTCTSLGAAHAKFIVHRDLKPDNIFIVGDPAVTGGERPKILDFGIAKLSGEGPGMLKTNTGVVMGTPVFMSPEQCRGAGEVDHRSDIYSIACVMFMMLTGRPPFSGAGSGDLIAAHLREPAPLASSRVPELPPVIDQILQKCLQKRPEDRFQSMAELVQAIVQAEDLVMRTSNPTVALDASGLFMGTPLPALWQVPSLSGARPLIGPAGTQPPPAIQRPMTQPLTVPPPVTPPTTITGASGQTTPPTAPTRRWLIGGSAIVTLAIGVAIAVFATRRGGNTTEPASAQAPPPPPVTVTATVIAAPDAATPDAPAPMPEAVIQVPDARPAIDRGSHAPATKGRNGHPSSPRTPDDMDRGD